MSNTEDSELLVKARDVLIEYKELLYTRGTLLMGVGPYAEYLGSAACDLFLNAEWNQEDSVRDPNMGYSDIFLPFRTRGQLIDDLDATKCISEVQYNIIVVSSDDPAQEGNKSCSTDVVWDTLGAYLRDNGKDFIKKTYESQGITITVVLIWQ